ncbi:YciI family protein [Streptomyces sp. NPDC004267]|uniref:YciI family protein n=1 Tax=Streptomyces sp. NPDC004267 TaxID=3364694 RepID=UPI0036AE90E8
MEFLCYHRDRPGSLPLRQELGEAHWSYMDGYEQQLIARGPTFDRAAETLTGSVHIVELPDPAAARAFAFDEPNYQAGAYRDVMVRRWRNALGRTMWEYPGGRTGGNRYLVLGLGLPVRLAPGTDTASDTDGGTGTGSGTAAAPDLAVPADPDGDLIAYGPLLSDDGTTWLGTAAILRAPDAEAARALLTADAYADVEVHDWEMGGRR